MHLRPKRHALLVRTNEKRSRLISTKNDSRLAQQLLFMPRCPTKGNITARSEPCKRLLEQRGESRERRDQLTHPLYKKPKLLATAPNQL